MTQFIHVITDAETGEVTQVPFTQAEIDAYVLANTPTLAELKVLAWESIKALRDTHIQSGGYKVGSKWFHSDTFSRTQQIGLVMLGANIPAGLQWKTMDGSFVLMTQILAQQIFAAAAQQDTAIFTNAEFHRSAINALSSGDAITAYDITIGWPEIFA